MQDKLYRYALSIVFEQELAKDIVQEVFIKLWNHREKLADIQNLEAWNIRLTRNLAYDKLRLANRKTVNIDHARQQASKETVPDTAVENSDLLEAIQAIMTTLPEKQKEIFRLKDLLGYSNIEIQEMLQLNEGQVKVNLFRARQKIKLKLSKLMNYGLTTHKTAAGEILERWNQR